MTVIRFPHQSPLARLYESCFVTRIFPRCQSSHFVIRNQFACRLYLRLVPETTAPVFFTMERTLGVAVAVAPWRPA